MEESYDCSKGGCYCCPVSFVPVTSCQPFSVVSEFRPPVLNVLYYRIDASGRNSCRNIDASMPMFAHVIYTGAKALVHIWLGGQ